MFELDNKFSIEYRLFRYHETIISSYSYFWPRNTGKHHPVTFAWISNLANNEFYFHSKYNIVRTEQLLVSTVRWQKHRINQPTESDMYNYLEIQDELCLVRTLPIKYSISFSLDLHEVIHFHVKVYFLYVVSHPVDNFLPIWRRHHCQCLDLHCMISGDSLASNTYMFCKKRHPYDMTLSLCTQLTITDLCL